jgi:hypothetical protein
VMRSMGVAWLYFGIGQVNLGFFGSSLAAPGWNRLELAGTENFEKIS